MNPLSEVSSRKLATNRSISCPPYIDDRAPSFHNKAGEIVPSFFTEDAKKAFMELRSENHGTRSESQKLTQKQLRRNPNHGQGASESTAKASKEHQSTSFPPITMLLKPKDQSKVKLANLRQRQSNQTDPSKVTDASICEESLKRALSKLRQASAETGLNLNTKTLWRQSSFLPPSTEKRSLRVAERAREFEEWREDAWRTWHRAASTAPAALPGPAGPGASPADAADGGVGEMSPRALTGEEAAARLEPARLHALALERQLNDVRHQRREAEKEAAQLRGEIELLARTRAEAALQDATSAAAARKAKAEQGLDRAQAQLHREAKMRQQREFLKARLVGMVGEDERSLQALHRELRQHAHDLDALRQRLQDEAPRLERGLLANEIKEAQFVLESVRVKYAQELQVRRAAVVENARVRQEMTASDARYKALEEELVRMHDPNATTPRRTEMRNKLVAYEQAFSMMFRRLGDTDIDRLVALFLSTRSNKMTWEEAVRDAEARAEELRRERDRLAQGLARSRSAGSRDGMRGQTAAEVERKIRDLQDKVRSTSRLDMSRQRHDSLLALISSFYSGIQAAMVRFAKMGVADPPPAQPSDVVAEVVGLTRAWAATLDYLASAVDSSRIMKSPTFRGLSPISIRSAAGSKAFSIASPRRRLAPGPRPAGLGSPLARSGGAGASGVREVLDAVLAAVCEAGARAADALVLYRSRQAAAQAPSTSNLDADASALAPAPATGGAAARPQSEVARRGSGGLDGAQGDSEELEEELIPGPARRTWPNGGMGGAGGEWSESGSSGYDSDGRNEPLYTFPAPDNDGAGAANAEPPEGGPGGPYGPGGGRRRSMWVLGASSTPGGPPKWTLRTSIDVGLGLGKMEDLGLFPREVVLQTMQDSMWPNRPTQLRVRMPRRLRREDRRLGHRYPSTEAVGDDGSDEEYSSGSQKSFDYDEVVEEFEDMYAERDKTKRRAAKAELAAAKKREED